MFGKIFERPGSMVRVRRLSLVINQLPSPPPFLSPSFRCFLIDATIVTGSSSGNLISCHGKESPWPAILN